MTWTKLGTDMLDPMTDLSVGAALAHVEALMYSNRAGLDLRIPETRLRFLPHPPTAAEVRELIDAEWWRRDGTVLDVGLRWPDWQMTAEEVEARRKANALRQERKRRHDADDHAICLPKTCRKAVTRDEPSDEQRDPARQGTALHGRGRQEGETQVPAPREEPELTWPKVSRPPDAVEVDQARGSWRHAARGYDD